MLIGGLAVVQTVPGAVCSPRRTLRSSNRPRNPNPNQRPRKKRRRRRRRHHLRRHLLQRPPRQPSPPCRSPNLSLRLRVSSRWHYTSTQDTIPWSLLSDFVLLAIATTQRRTTNCLSARVTGSLRSKLSQTIGGLVATSMIMLVCSRVRPYLRDVGMWT